MYTNVTEILDQLESLLSAEEQKRSITGISDLTAHLKNRAALREHAQSLTLAVEAVQARLANLPALPPLREIAWAQAISQFDNLAFLEVDTTGLESSAEIIRVLLLDTHGATVFDQCLRPTHPLPSLITQITGLTVQDVADAPTLPDVWNKFLALLTGRYILAYNLRFDRSHLSANAGRHGLDMPVFIGDCLQEHAMRYFHERAFPKLERLCQNVGSPLPEQPHQTAHDRALGQLHLLEAMAQGRTGLTPSPPSTAKENELDDPLADLEDHPF